MQRKQSIYQGFIIDNLQAYVNDMNLPFEVNRSGICHGLAVVHGNYVLAGKDEEFDDILQKIAGNKKLTKEDDSTIAKFCNNVLIAYSPDSMNIYNFGQNNSWQLINPNPDKPINTLFNLALVANKQSWVEIFEKINLQDNDVMLLESASHSVSLKKEGDNYYLYDPNNNKLYREFNNEKDLVNYLKSKSFNYRGDNLGLSIKVMSHSTPENSQYPTIDDIYNDYYKNEEASFSGNQIDSLAMSCRANCTQAVKYLLDKINDKPSESEKKKLIAELGKVMVVAIHRNSHDSVTLLLDKMKDINGGEIPAYVALAALKSSAEQGNGETFNKLFTGELNGFYRLVLNLKFKKIILENACKGGNVEIIKQISSETKFSFTDEESYNLIKACICSNNHESVNYVLAKLSIDDKETQLKLLVDALEKNNPLIVNVLIDKFSFEANDLARIKIQLSTIQKTNVAILEKLVDKGMPISDKAQNIIKQKNNESIGVFSKLGIQFTRFSEFLKRHFGGAKRIDFHQKSEGAHQSPQTDVKIQIDKPSHPLQDESKASRKRTSFLSVSTKEGGASPTKKAPSPIESEETEASHTRGLGNSMR